MSEEVLRMQVRECQKYSDSLREERDKLRKALETIAGMSYGTNENNTHYMLYEEDKPVHVAIKALAHEKDNE